MHEKQTGSLPYWQFESWPNGRLHHAVFTRQGGVGYPPFATLNLSVSVPDDKETVYANRRLAYGLLGRDTHTVVHAHLVHGNGVAVVTQADNGTWTQADGLLTNEPGCALTMNFADCVPIFLFDPVQQVIGLGHAGWQGTIKDLPGAMVQQMIATFGSRSGDLLAGIGPCIGVCCYEVDEPVISQVRERFGRVEGLLVGQEGKARPHLDLVRANQLNLEQAGVDHIETSGLCTACRTDLFFSHRAEKGHTGRFGAVMMIPIGE
ncbi:MAG: peptidoglycan editing factor PgeF [Anaerolineae bacterium]|nr:peptidoglycan editing factor PgeF [Anaerolineae bacterium]